MEEETVESSHMQNKKKNVTKSKLSQQNVKRKREATAIHADGSRSQKAVKVQVSYTYFCYTLDK